MRVAAVQFHPLFAMAAANAERIAEIIREQAAGGVELVVFPEAAVTGYCFSSAEEARAAAVSVDSLTVVASACLESGVYAIVGFAEAPDIAPTPRAAGAGEDLPHHKHLGEGTSFAIYNSAAFFGPSGLIGVYRKSHIPCLGLDRFVEAGNELPVFETPIGKIGILICFDIRFPEAARTLALAGAEVICLPTNWPESAEPSSDIICPARTIENNVFVVAANRVGTENGFRFVGKSKIIAPGGKILATQDDDSEAVISADIDVSLARNKNIVKKPGEYELPLFEGRRPELYRVS